jgi:DNA polymerase I
MICKGDAKGLEWVAGTYLSQDKTALEEIWAGVDQHSLNQKAFNLPSRLIAKTFVFRLMYGGSAYSYANDPDFTHVSSNQKYWQKVIDAFYEKYSGFAKWHKKIVVEAMQNKQLIMPTGRVYLFDYRKGYRGELEAPQTIIKNYPVQGLGADLMSIARVSFMKRFKEQMIDGLLVNSVHDDIVTDIKKHELERVIQIFYEVFRDIPANFEKLFGKEFNLPMNVEVSYGSNMGELDEVKLDK